MSPDRYSEAYYGLKKEYDRLLDLVLEGRAIDMITSPTLQEKLRRRLNERAKQGLR